MKTGSSLTTHWWMALMALPRTPDGDAYHRLHKIWADKTRFRDRDASRRHEFVSKGLETHLTATLWENFALFSPHSWLTALSGTAGTHVDHAKTEHCNWCYGLRDKPTGRIADVVIGFDGVEVGTGCYVIEAKRPGEPLTSKDLDPDYYLGLQAIARHASELRLIYLVGGREKQRVTKLLSSEPEKYSRCSVISWEDLATLQIRLAQQLDASPAVRSFVAGAIQYQFCEHGIVPTSPSEDYLVGEPSIADVDASLVRRSDNHDLQWLRLSADGAEDMRANTLPRRSLLPVTQDLDQALDALAEACDALIKQDVVAARRWLVRADQPLVMAHAKRAVGAMDLQVHRVTGRPKAVPAQARDPRRMPTESEQRAIFIRDGWRCRFCGIRVIAKETVRVFRAVFPKQCRWDGREFNKHAALYAFQASLDHVMPHSRGGRNEVSNFVTACTCCQYGRGDWLLQEMQLLDPRDFPPHVDDWDGLTRLLNADIKTSEPA